MNLGVYLGHFTQLFRPLHLYQGPCYVVAQVIPTMAATVLRCSLWRRYGTFVAAWVPLQHSRLDKYRAMAQHEFIGVSMSFAFFSFSEGWWHCNYLGQCWGGFRGLVWSSFQAAGKATQMSRCKCRCLPNIPIWCTGATIDARQAGGAIPPDIQRQLQDVRKLQSTTKAGAWLTRVR